MSLLVPPLLEHLQELLLHHLVYPEQLQWLLQPLLVAYALYTLGSVSTQAQMPHIYIHTDRQTQYILVLVMLLAP